MQRSSRKTLHAALFVLVSLALVWALLQQITVADLRRLAARLTPSRIGALCVLYALTALIRGVRLGYLLRERDVLKLASITALHAFLNHVLPFRLGELSLPLLVRTFTARGLVSGSLSLVVIRLYDSVGIAFLALLSLLIAGRGLDPRMDRALALGAGLVIVGCALSFRYLGRWARVAARSLAALLRAAGAAGPAARAAGLGAHMEREIGALDARQKYILLPWSSLAVTFATYIFFYWVMVFVGIDLGFFRNVLASLGEAVVGLLPNAIGSFGTLEAGWAAGYVLCGVDRADAVATGFIMHGIVVLAGLILSAGGLTYLLWERRYRRASGTSAAGGPAD